MKAVAKNPAQRLRALRREGILTGKVRLGGIITHDVSRRDAERHEFSVHLKRLREIELIIRVRHGSEIPDTDDADLYIGAAAYALNAHCRARGGDLDLLLAGWCSRWAPWALPRAGTVIRPILNSLVRRRHDLKADVVAARLQVRYEERQLLGLNTIGACDVSRQMRRAMAKNRKRKLDRERQAAIRQQSGSQSRASYLAANSASRLEPWAALNISRRTWYRRFGTGSSPVGDIHPSGDGLVPTVTPDEALVALVLSAKGAPSSKADNDAGNANGGTEQCDGEHTLRRMGGANG